MNIYGKKEFISDMLMLKGIIKETDKITEFVGIEDRIGKSIYQQEDFIVKLLESKYGDDDSWISWFVYDNNFGKSDLEASPSKIIGMKKVKSLSDLWKYIK